MHERVRAWEHGEPIMSGAADVGRVVLSPEHTEVLAGIRRPYADVWIAHIDHNLDLTEAERELCRVLHRAFKEVVDWDAERGGLRPASSNLYAGVYPHGPTAVRRWHPDGGPRASSAVARWVLAFGNGSTEFAEGPMQKDMITPKDWQLKKAHRVGEDGELRLRTLGVGVVGRFMAHLDVHSPPTPPGRGPRLLFGATSHDN